MHPLQHSHAHPPTHMLVWRPTAGARTPWELSDHCRNRQTHGNVFPPLRHRHIHLPAAMVCIHNRSAQLSLLVTTGPLPGGLWPGDRAVAEAKRRLRSGASTTLLCLHTR
jgi:hypothetical protein